MNDGPRRLGPIDRSRHEILVVDDNPDGAESLASLLRLMGASVSVAHDGLSALRLVREGPPEVVVCDIGMPGMSGLEVARRLRGQLGYQGLLVALTGWGQEDDRRRSREAGFDHHFVKPVDPDELQELIAKLP